MVKFQVCWNSLSERRATEGFFLICTNRRQKLQLTEMGRLREGERPETQCEVRDAYYSF